MNQLQKRENDEITNCHIVQRLFSANKIMHSMTILTELLLRMLENNETIRSETHLNLFNVQEIQLLATNRYLLQQLHEPFAYKSFIIP